jgi:iron complex transport system ATP-binding protein
MNPMLHTEDLLIGYDRAREGGMPLLPPINLNVAKGTICGLIGANGTGKTTLLRTIAGYLKPIGGAIKLGDKKLNELTSSERAGIISVVLTDRIEDPFLKVRDVVSMGRHPYTGFLGKLQRIDEQIIDESLQQTGVDHLQHKRMAGISDGERQKVMIAKALAQDTPLILLDEPAAYLDYPSRLELMQLLQKLARIQEKTILISSHDLEILVRKADHLWLLGSGRPAVEGMPEHLILNGSVSSYFGSESLFFESLTGQASFSDQADAVYVSADKYSALWIRNALLRKGFRLSDHSTSLIHVEYQNNTYVIKNEQHTVHQTDSLSGMLDALSGIIH